MYNFNYKNYIEHCIINLPPTYPVCLQTTSASLLSQKSSHTVPYIPLIHISTLPSELVDPSTSRISPCEQATRRWETLLNEINEY